MKTLLKLEVKEEKKTLASLLSTQQIEEINCGKLVPSYDGNRMRLDQEVKGTVFLLTPLQAG
jgi:hypothetical protein